MENIWNEITTFSESLSVLEQNKNYNEDKKAALVQHLVATVSIEQVTLCLSQCGDDQELRRACERVLSTLMDAAPSETTVNLLLAGLSESDANNRASALQKLIDSNRIVQQNNELVLQATIRIKDVDTKVASLASTFIKKRFANNSVMLKTLQEILVEAFTKVSLGKAGRNEAQGDVYLLRVWELAAELVSLPTGMGNETQSLLDSLFATFNVYNEDILFVLNMLEIINNLLDQKNNNSTLVTSFKRNPEFRAMLLRYARESEIVSEQALRILATLYSDVTLIPQLELDPFFTILDSKLGLGNPQNFSLASLEIFGTLIGNSVVNMKYVLECKPASTNAWKKQVIKYAYGGNDLPRVVAIDALCRALRNGSRLSAATISSEESAITNYGLLKTDLVEVLKCVTMAIQSAHLQVQMAAYLLLQMLVSQNSNWGVQKVLELVPNNLLFDAKINSPNANRDVYEMRYKVLQAIPLEDYLHPNDDEEVIREIKRAIIRGPMPSSSALRTAQVVVETEGSR